jgi:hypothetical protein
VLGQASPGVRVVSEACSLLTPYGPAMPSYRLLDGHGRPTDTFTAACDEEATAFGKVRALDFPRPEPRFGARRDFQVHRQDGERWTLLVAWAPV